MKKQILSFLSLSLFSFLFLTSCGGGGDNGPDNNALNAGIQGTWDLGSVTTNPANFITGFRITFTSTDLTGTIGTFTLVINGVTVTGQYTITNSSTNSGTIQLTINTPSGGFNGSTSIILASFNIGTNTITFNADINDNKQISATYSFSLDKQS